VIPVNNTAVKDS